MPPMVCAAPKVHRHPPSPSKRSKTTLLRQCPSQGPCTRGTGDAGESLLQRGRGRRVSGDVIEEGRNMRISPARLRPTSRSSPCGRCVELTAELGASAVAVAARQTQQTGETHRRKERRGGRRRRITNGASTARGWGARGRNHRNWNGGGGPPAARLRVADSVSDAELQYNTNATLTQHSVLCVPEIHGREIPFPARVPSP